LRLKILKKLGTASLNSEFTGSYKKSVVVELNSIQQEHDIKTYRPTFRP